MIEIKDIDPVSVWSEKQISLFSSVNGHAVNVLANSQMCIDQSCSALHALKVVQRLQSEYRLDDRQIVSNT
ncbi:uncharacterized protein PHALS_15299 [Plasmopara halstedii]|uniref:Uncharacterized protein n=1 Tax=Plasmopara halstedii TaxID=4781 RepID=A0A0P1ACQ2_PLAHL|nr:uncharacterized protein PHALS_15299 [Plasmopara halstedii]CEG38271.1 hypothetical protein PHALS_15299 [Plasmopara halstedii]|eukprot:XP_024574640.1 hypothetical protein PHALS_15299 [Plasmopara halstedii]